MIQEKIFGILGEKNSEMPLLHSVIESCKGQLDGVIVSDNSDRPEPKEELRKMKEEFGGFLEIIWNEIDLGNSVAFNDATKLAIEHGATWTVTLTDDSPMKPDFIKTMLAAYNKLSEEQKKSIGLITPNLLTIRGYVHDPQLPAHITEFGGTSEGQMVKTSVFPIVGFYNAGFFMDGFDGEFCHRVRAKGFKNLMVPHAICETRWGHPDMRKFFGKTILIPNYGAYRYYFASRNFMYQYLHEFRLFVLQNPEWYYGIWAILIPRYMIKMVLFEKEKGKKLRAYFYGTWHGILGRLGPMPENVRASLKHR